MLIEHFAVFFSGVELLSGGASLPSKQGVCNEDIVTCNRSKMGSRRYSSSKYLDTT